MVDSNYSKSTGKFWYFGKVDVHEKWSHGEVRLLHVHVFSMMFTNREQSFFGLTFLVLKVSFPWYKPWT